MTFGAANLNSPELIISKEAFADCDNIIQVCAHTAADDSLLFIYVQAALIYSHIVSCASRMPFKGRLCAH